MTASRGIRTKQGIRQTFVEVEQGKHICKCGCGEPITIRIHHFNVGIPEFILGHNTRVAPPAEAHQRARRLRETMGPTIVREYEAGATCLELGKKYGVSNSTIATIVKEYGVQIRPFLLAEGHPFYRNWGPDHPYWKGGSRVTVDGYRKVWLSPDHPFAAAMGHKGESYVYEHRLVMAHHLNRPLRKGETVHHIDGDRLNNSIENLQLRNGSHNRGIKLQCLDCGSHNVEPVRLD